MNVNVRFRNVQITALKYNLAFFNLEAFAFLHERVLLHFILCETVQFASYKVSNRSSNVIWIDTRK